jgi:hypothetical protein
VLGSPFSIKEKGCNNCQQQQPPTTTTTTTTMTTTATEDQRRKQVRISDPSELSTIMRSSVIVNFITRSFASLPTPIKSLASHYTDKLTKLQNKARQRSITIDKMAGDNYIPTSARINFELGASQKVKETATFATLAVSTKELVERFQKTLKANMLTVAKLELSSIQSDMNTTILEAVRDLTTITSEKESTCILPFVHPNEHVITCSSFMWLEIHASTEEFTLFLYVRTSLVIASHSLFPHGQKDALTTHLIHAN